MGYDTASISNQILTFQRNIGIQSPIDAALSEMSGFFSNIVQIVFYESFPIITRKCPDFPAACLPVNLLSHAAVTNLLSSGNTYDTPETVYFVFFETIGSNFTSSFSACYWS